MTAAEVVQLLQDGARYDDLDDVDEALQRGADVNSADTSGRSALHMASANGHILVVNRLLQAGARPNVENSEGSTPLHWACFNGQKEVVQLLLDKGASVTAVNKHVGGWLVFHVNLMPYLHRVGRTPFDEALSQGHQAIRDIINQQHPIIDEEDDVDEAGAVNVGPQDAQDEEGVQLEGEQLKPDIGNAAAQLGAGSSTLEPSAGAPAAMDLDS